jgi:peptide/nickel transport system permease protein
MALRSYAIRRLGQIGVTYFVFLCILFVMFRLLPGDPTSRFILSGMSEEGRQQLIRELGLNEPLHVQFLVYVQNLLTGQLGLSFTYREPVWNILVVKFWNTVFLMGTALALAFVVGVTVGALLGWYRGSTFEKGGLVVTLVARSSPEFLTGIFVLMVFVFWLGLFPPGGMRQPGAAIDGFWARYLSWDFVYHAVLPVASATIYFSTLPALLMRNSMLDVLKADFVEMKDAEGIPPRRVLFRHVVRNSILPIVTLLATASGLAIGGSIVIETVFSWPGMGREMFLAVRNNDYPLAMGLFYFMGIVVIFMNFLADLAYVYLDPRVEYD